MYQRIGKDGKRYWGRRGAGILFTDGQKILLLLRAGGAADQGGKWCIPGGKTEEGETPLDTAKRETREEIGTLKGTKFASFDEKDNHHVFTVFLYKVPGPFEDIHLSDEHNKYKWVDIDDIKDLPLHPEFAKHISYYIKAIRKKFPRSFSEWLGSR